MMHLFNDTYNKGEKSGGRKWCWGKKYNFNEESPKKCPFSFESKPLKV